MVLARITYAVIVVANGEVLSRANTRTAKGKAINLSHLHGHGQCLLEQSVLIHGCGFIDSSRRSSGLVSFASRSC